MKIRMLAASFVISLSLMLAGCSKPPVSGGASLAAAQPPKVKNIILMIGDGMGPQQVGLLQTYAQRAPNSIYGERSTNIQRMIEEGVLGLSNTWPSDHIVADSACSATQLATGYPVINGAIGVGGQGEPLQTLVEEAKRLGKSSGLVSDTRLVHATPAAFAAHQLHRSMQDDIAEDMIRIAPDVMFSGGLRRFVPAQVNEKGTVHDALLTLTGNSFELSSKRKDELNLLDKAKDQGFELVFNREQMLAATGDKLLGLFANSAMMNGIDYSATRTSEMRTEPTLREMAAKALSALARNEQGFFLMIEGGQIDWAGHQNDTGTMLHEMIKFDDAIGYVLDWAMQRDDTLVLVTADHETGSFGFSYSIDNIPQRITAPGVDVGDQPYKPMFNFAEPEVLDRIYAQDRSNQQIWLDFKSLPAAQQVPATLAEMMAQHHDFVVTEAMAARAMQRSENSYYVKGHPFLDSATWPATKSLFDAFYVYGDAVHVNLMGHILAAQQNVVWGTGTHTATPVLVMAYGPQLAMQRFSTLLTHPQVGQITKELLRASVVRE